MSSPRVLSATPVFILEDDVETLGHGQLRKSEFIALALDALAGEVSASDGRPLSRESCPSFAFWTRFYARQPASHIERALRSLIGAHIPVRSAAEYAPLLAAEVARRRRRRELARAAPSLDRSDSEA